MFRRQYSRHKDVIGAFGVHGQGPRDTFCSDDDPGMGTEAPDMPTGPESWCLILGNCKAARPKHLKGIEGNLEKKVIEVNYVPVALRHYEKAY